MNRKIFITIGVISVIAVGIALGLTHGSGAVHSFTDAVAIILIVTVLGFQAWLRDRLFNPETARRGKARPSYHARPHIAASLPARSGIAPSRGGGDARQHDALRSTEVQYA